ncbi:hypothetical protein EJ02DRAFT_398732 [Clathrospora elynae]|uniref:N-acetyltransferase domain-containing protein n=1 Tax=Clathrospora elynae TaxID=706981 RepID=A0A6A5T0E8_9PLEO|nr:hypothetical protein EJ02DRAFT_398732 [Clathrospora elynae]
MLSCPSVDGVRLATPEDLYRISIVAAAAFFWSPTFRFQRPHYKDFPSDTIASYFYDYEKAIKDPASVVFVAEDVVEENEADNVYEELRYAYTSQTPGIKGLVGVCSVLLKPGSCYIGCFQPGDGLVHSAQHGISDLKRDHSTEALDIYTTITTPSKLKHLQGIMRLSTLAVAPAYWRRGHASKLVRFCSQLADMDSAVLGVSATPLGTTVVCKAGFQERAHIRYTRPKQQKRRYAANTADIELWIGLRLPGSTPFSCSVASPLESPTCHMQPQP